MNLSILDNKVRLGHEFAYDDGVELLGMIDDQKKSFKALLDGFIGTFKSFPPITNHSGTACLEFIDCMIENQKTDLETSRLVQVSHLNSLLGKPEQQAQRVKNDLNFTLPLLQSDTLISSAMQNRDQMKLAQQKAKLAALRYSLTISQNNPVVNAFVSGGIHNGYIPYMYDPKANFVAGIGIKVPIFDGKRNKYRLVVVIQFAHQYIYIMFVGSHAQYDKIDCNTI